MQTQSAQTSPEQPKSMSEVEAHQARAAEILKDHTYTQLTNTQDMQAWRCKAPGTRSYSFDIISTDQGTTVMGDIGNLIFRHYYQEGVAFLAYADVEGYIYSRLVSASRRTVYREEVKHDIVEQMMDALVKDLEELELKLSEKVEGEISQLKITYEPTDSSIKVLAKALESILERSEECLEEYREDESWEDEPEEALSWRATAKVVKTVEHLEELEKVNDLDSAIAFVRDISSFDVDYEALSFEQMCPALKSNLYVVNHAAQQIQALRNAGQDA